MQTKSHGSPKENESKIIEVSNLEWYYRKSRTTVTDRIIELYRGILSHIKPDTTFESTIDLMVALGCFSSLKTKNELRVMYDTHVNQETVPGGVNV